MSSRLHAGCMFRQPWEMASTVVPALIFSSPDVAMAAQDASGPDDNFALGTAFLCALLGLGSLAKALQKSDDQGNELGGKGIEMLVNPPTRSTRIFFAGFAIVALLNAAAFTLPKEERQLKWCGPVGKARCKGCDDCVEGDELLRRWIAAWIQDGRSSQAS